MSHIATLVQTLTKDRPGVMDAVRLVGVGKLAIAVSPREATR